MNNKWLWIGTGIGFATFWTIKSIFAAKEAERWEKQLEEINADMKKLASDVREDQIKDFRKRWGTES